MAKTICYGIKDTDTGLFMTGYNANSPIDSTFGNEQDAVCFTTEAQRDSVVAVLNQNEPEDHFVGANPKPR